MAKITLMEAIKKMFGDKLDSEIEVDDSKDDKEEQSNKDDKTDDKASDRDGNKKVDNKSTDGTDGKEEKTMAVLENGWYDAKTGKIDVTKVKDETVLEALNMLNGNISATKEEFMVSNAINEAVGKLQLSISTDMFKKLIDTSNVKVKDGKVVGLTEALDAVKTAEPGIFKGEQKKTENNPLNQGFDPVTKNNAAPGSWNEAFAMQEASTN